MLWTIVEKEFWENLLDQRFAVSLILAALTAWTSTFILTKTYNEEVNDYYRRVNFQNRMIDEYFHMSAWHGGIMMPPKPRPVLSSLVRGVQRDLVFFGSLDENPVPILFSPMDILFIIGIIMSIAALTLSYDHISGEKEAGTLKMLIIGSYARAKIVFGKWFGGLLSILLILMIVFTGSALIAYTLSASSWRATEWIALGAIFILSALYCAFFHSLGLYVSAKTQSPSDSIILSLVLWVLFTLIIPTVPPYIASAIYSTPSPAKIQYEVFFTLRQERDDAIKALRAPYITQGMNENAISEITKDEIDKIIAEYENKEDQLKGMAVKQSLVREAITALFHFLSPFSSYILAGAEMTATGAFNQVTFIDKAQGFVSDLYYKYLPRKIQEAKSKDPNYTETTKLDVRDRPRFQYEAEGIPYRLLASAIHSVFILIYTLLFFVLAWKSFLRYDVR